MNFIKAVGFFLMAFVLPVNCLAQASASYNYATETGTLGTTYSWIDCSGGTDIVTGDDHQASISWPFNFMYYNNSYNTSNSLSVATNGFIRLDGIANGADYNAASAYNLTTNATGFGQIIAASIYDCQLGNIASSWVRYLVTGTTPYRVVTIEYNNIEIDYNDGLYADVQVSLYETLNKVVIKFGNDNISSRGVDMGIHSGVPGFFHKWQEVESGTNNTWIEYMPPVEINATVGTSLSYYSNIKSAFDKINDGTHRGEIVIKVHVSTSETASAVLNGSGSGNAYYTSVNIYPTSSGLSISGNLTAPLINFNGADNVTLDGRVNASGGTKDLTVINTRVSSAAGTSTIQYINEASNNILQYCTIKGSETRTTSGVIFFSTSSATNGNNNNTIRYNNITTASNANRPINAIFSFGTSGKENRNNIISENEIFDFLKHGTASNGISLTAGTTAWTISGNSFYETTTFVPTGTVSYNVIQISNTSGGDFTVSDNYIGGSALQCTGTAWTKTDANNNAFKAININISNSLTNSIQNNIIRNFSWSNSGNASWTGISVGAGSVNIGTTTGNTIGEATGTGSILLTGGSSGQTFYGIDVAGNGTIVCSNNTIGSVTVASDNSAFAGNFYGINRTNTGTNTFSYNSIGSISQPNSITTSSASTGNVQSVFGIRNTTGGVLNIISNIICNLSNGTTNTTTGTLGLISGISSNYGINNISNNAISNLSISNANSASSNAASVTGIAVASTNALNTIDGNTIYNLSNTYNSFTGSVIGLYFGSTGMYTTPSHMVTGNFIHSLTITGSSASTAAIYGIKINTGQTTYANNIINLSGNTANTLYGIYEYGTAANNNSIYFNTAYVSGNLGSGVTNKSYAFYSAVTSNVRNIRNNVFVNTRSTISGSGLHYATYFNYAVNASLTADYNDYFVSGTGAVLGYFGGDKATLPIVTSQDAHSIAIDPVFTNAGGTSATDYSIAASLPGVPGTGITTDYNGLTRGALPQMGALEANYFVWQGSISTDFAIPGNWAGGEVPPEGADIYFPPNPDRSCVLDQNRTLKSITNAQSADQLIVNSFQLTLTGNLIFSNGARIDATASASKVVFAGVAPQSIPLGAFVGNTIDGLKINNPQGLTLNGDLTVNDTLALTDGSFSLGANTLTLNGTISAVDGILTGGSSTNITIAGSSAGATLHEIELNNLVLNRSNGISLGGDVSINGTLTLTNGTLTLGPNSLIISGNSPVKTNGYVDASNIGSTIAFSNSSAIILPASFFTGDVYNLTINGSGGITVISDFTINGILSLQSVNPSATKGCLDLWDGTVIRTLTMGPSATTIGAGDVTGIVARNSFTSGIQYSFGSQHTFISFIPGGTFPDFIRAKISIGVAPTWKPEAINRVYDFIQSGGSNSIASISTRYLESELNGNNENDLSQWTFGANGQLPSGSYDWGFTNYDEVENWVEIAHINISYFPTAFGNLENTLATSVANYVLWNGSVSSVWDEPGNWTPGNVPSSTTYVVIPSAETTTHDPILPAVTEINNIWLQTGAVLNSGNNSVLTLTGNVTWINAGGIFNPDSGNVIFANSQSNISGTTSFYNLSIPDTTTVWLSLGSHIKIAGAIINNGILRTVISGETTVEYNGTGNQTVVVPNISTNRYYNLILSGSGIKSLPGSLNIIGDFSVLESSSTTAAGSLYISGSVIIGADASFSAGGFNHTIGGNFDNGGTFSASSSKTITLNGTTLQSIFGNAIIFEKLTIDNASGANLFADILVNDSLLLASGNLSVGENVLSINGRLSKIAGFLNVSELSSLVFGGTNTLTLSSDLFTTSPSINNLTINCTAGIAFVCDLSVNGILSLQSVNPSSTSGSLDMGSNTLHMGSSSTTIGPGDVTGIVKRISIVPNIEYSFGNQFTTITFPNVGTLPVEISVKIQIGVAPGWKSGAINRIYDFIQTGGSGTKAVLKAHYLDSELNGNLENKIVDWSYRYSLSLLTEHGRSNFDTTDNWIALSNANVAFFASGFGAVELTLDESELTSLTWNGSLTSSWVTADNWTPVGAPSDNTIVIIPDATTTDNDPELPAIAACGTITIENGGILNSTVNAQLTLNGASGAWSNQGGTFNVGNSTIIFTNPAATINGTTNFNNITVNGGASLTLTTGSITGIAGAVSNNGIIDAGLFQNTVEYNGTNQTVIDLNGISFTGYHSLILSGSGTKTMPGLPMNINGSFIISGTAATTADESLTILEDFRIESGASFATGSFDHSIGGNIENNGTLTISSGETITLNGSSAQAVLGSAEINLEKLTIDNASGVNLFKDISVNDILTLTTGNLIVGATTVSINGTLSKSGGFIEVGPTSSLNIGGTAALAIPYDVFYTQPSVKNLTINCPGGVALGNQNITVKGLLSLITGTFTIGSNTLTIEGGSPARTFGNINGSNAGATIVFSNSGPIILPASIFSGNINNITINETGGVTSEGDISLSGILNLASTNPSAIKGLLDMGSNTLSMGSLSHVVGIGDAIGIVKREHIFNDFQEYCFGNEYTRITFMNTPGTTKPTWISFKISMGIAPEWRATAVKRNYSFAKDMGDEKVILQLHYLDSELDASEPDESLLFLWDAEKDGVLWEDIEPQGKLYNNSTDNWVNLSGMSINYIAPSAILDEKQWGLSYSDATRIVWTGIGNFSGDWSDPGNWYGGVPSSTDDVLIPGGLLTTYPYRNLIPGLVPAVAKTIEIEPGASFTMNSYDLTVYGSTNAWLNHGTFSPGVGTVYFSNGSLSNIMTIEGTTNFNHLRVNANTHIQPASISVIRIAGELISDISGILDFTTNINTIEYNGTDQFIVNPNGTIPGYYNLTLSGSGTKTLSNNTMDLAGDLAISGTAMVLTSEDLNVEGNLSIATGCILSVSSTSNMSILGTITNNAGTNGLILQSDASGTASLIHNSDSVPATMECYMGGAAEAWHFISSPVSDQEISGTWLPSGTYGNGTGYDLYLWNEANNCWIYNLDNTSPVNWSTVHPGADFETVRGYLYAVQVSNPTKEFAGKLNNGPLSFGLTSKSDDTDLKGFNLVGNPYPSAIDWSSTSGWSRNSLLNTGGGYDMWIWNPAVNNYGVYNSADSDGTGTNSVTRYIATMQGYFVQAGNDGDLGMDNDVRFYNGTTNLLKSAKQEVVKISVGVKSNAGYGSDEIQLKFGYDENENGAMKLFSKVLSAPSLYLASVGDYLSVLYYTGIKENPIVPLQFSPGSNGDFAMNCNFDLSKFETVLLEDLQTKNIQNMKEEKTYLFYASKTDNQNRFVLHFKPIDIQPVEKFPANMYISGGRMIIDLTLINKETEVFIYDIMGRLLLQRQLQGETTHDLSVHSSSQILVVYLRNPDGSFVQKINWQNE